MTADELSAVNYDEVAVQETYKSSLRCFLNAHNGVGKKGQGSVERNGAFTDIFWVTVRILLQEDLALAPSL